MDQTLTDLAGRLRGLRSDAGLTLRELSVKVHVSDSSLSRYFTAQALPPWTVVESLADLAGADRLALRASWEAAARARKRARWVSEEPVWVRPARPTPRIVPVALLVASAVALGWVIRSR
jgi:transcriptional regulator with XRE-family HTH domain